MSTTAAVAEKIRLKIIERNARNFVSSLSGVKAEVFFVEEGFELHRYAFSKTCAIDSEPEVKFIHPVNKDEIIDWICQKAGVI
jgi:hypothetical protein